MKPLSLAPLTPERALRAFMKIDPARLREREKREKRKARRGLSTG
jgi:hypothetical protein